MRYKKFKTIKEPLSTIGFGCWGLSGGTSWTHGKDNLGIDTVRTAIDSGINFFDVAPIYGLGHAETLLGNGIAGKRNKVFIASKCGMVWDDSNNVILNLSKKSILKEIDQSLKRLNTNYIDLYQMHWPDKDTKAPIEESFEAMMILKKQGKIRYIGLTNFSQKDAQLGVDEYGLASYQGLYNLLEHNPKHYHNIPLAYRSRKEMLPFCEKNSLPFLPYSPIMQGLLTDHFDPKEWSNDDVRQPNPKFHGDLWVTYQQFADKVKDFANKINKPVVQVALNWLIIQKAIGPVICGGIEPAQIEQNVNALQWELTQEMFDNLELIISDKLKKLEAE